ncbi:fibrous sheath CABYR-binding protein isoform X7 [Nothobranchius furzeri]|uniref:Transcript variant X6 n=1 Tax=Nothobranchius furzeri TaxID=105023 RepID=A0A9D2XEK5_NOTFU|nr:transcript variant X6 [Nothobranchius furzeri]
MPSKRKKNKRRMRRVQAQRRALEEQHAANPPIKASPGTAVSAPPTTTPTKVPEPASPPSENKPRVIPITVPVVQTPKVEPQPAVKEPVAEPVQAEVTTKEPDVELLLQVPAEVEVEIHPEVEAEAHITEAPLVGWTPPVESVTDEAGVGQEAELDVPEPEPVNETHDVRAPEAEILSEEVTEDKVELEVAVTEDVSVPEHVREPSEDPAVEDLSNHVSAEAEAAADVADGSMVAAVAERPELEQESPSPAASIQEEVLEDAAAEEAPVLSAGIPEQVKEAEVSETKEVGAGVCLHDYEVDDVTARAWPAEGALTASAVIQQEFIIAGTESRDVSPAAAAPPEDEVSSNSAEQTSLSASSEEPKTEACDATCLIQLPVKSVQLGSVVNQPGNFSGNSSEWTHCSRSFN